MRILNIIKSVSRTNTCEEDRSTESFQENTRQEECSIDELASRCVRENDLDAAIALYNKAVEIEPDNAAAYNNLGNIYKTRGMLVEAMVQYKNALRLDRKNAVIYNNIGLVYCAQGKLNDAMACYERAIAIKPDFADAHNNLGNVFKVLCGLDDAIAHYERAIIINPDYAEALNNLGNVLKEMGRYEEAIERYGRAIAIRPDYADAHYNMGNLLREQGKLSEAMEHYDRTIAISPEHREAHYNRSNLKTFRNGDADLAALETLADGDSLTQNQQPYIHFALAKAFEDSGDFDRAFEYMRQGNALKRKQLDYDEAAEIERFERTAAIFNRSLFDRFGEAGDPSTVPIFVLGMPRSGSTLVEQILASHPQIHGAGELANIDMEVISAINAQDLSLQYPESVPALDRATVRLLGQSYVGRLDVPEGAARIVDKTPGNFQNIGLLRLILPNARIIHTMRDPIDTCVSCYSKLFTTGNHYAYDLAELGRFYRRYSELMIHWRSVLPPAAMLEISYENVVADLEGQARRLIDYCGLPWDDRCLDFHRTSRPVKTASDVQVRTPLYRSSLQRWRRFESSLAPLVHELGDIIASAPSIHTSSI